MIKETSVLDENIFGKEKLPEMLNVLTIMTLGYSSMMFISGIINLFIAQPFIEEIQATVANHSQEIESMNNPLISKLFNVGMNAMNHFAELNLVIIAVAILSILAAWMMRRLKKSGFFVYLFATIVEIAVPIYILGNDFSTGLIVAGSFFSILFVILYGVNLKHLK